MRQAFHELFEYAVVAPTARMERRVLQLFLVIAVARLSEAAADPADTLGLDSDAIFFLQYALLITLLFPMTLTFLVCFKTTFGDSSYVRDKEVEAQLAYSS